jgi:hypothetical protein
MGGSESQDGAADETEQFQSREAGLLLLSMRPGKVKA